jgi:hypothetical protein
MQSRGDVVWGDAGRKPRWHRVKNMLPAWRIEAPAAADEFLGYYHDAESASDVG